MEHVLPLFNPSSKEPLYELNVSKDVKPYRRSRTVNSAWKDPTNAFDDDDSDPININPDNPFDTVWDNTTKKRQKYKPRFPKDDSFTDTNLDSTDTEPTDTDVDSSESEWSIYKTTSDESDETTPINPNTDAHGVSSPSFDPSEDDSDESTDTEYFDSDATTESSDKSYTSYSENIDDTPESSSEEDEPKSAGAPADEGPPETFKWSEDEEQMEIPVKDTGAKTIDPFEEHKKLAGIELDPKYGASAKPSSRASSLRETSRASGIVASIVNHLAPRNSVSFESDLERMSVPRFIQRSPVFKDNYQYSNSILK